MCRWSGIVGTAQATNPNNNAMYTRGLIWCRRSAEPSDWPLSYKVPWHHQWWRGRHTRASRVKIQNISLGLRRPSQPNVDMVIIYFISLPPPMIYNRIDRCNLCVSRTRSRVSIFEFYGQVKCAIYSKLLLSLRASVIVKPFSYKPLASMPLMEINDTNISPVACSQSCSI